MPSMVIALGQTAIRMEKRLQSRRSKWQKLFSEFVKGPFKAKKESWIRWLLVAKAWQAEKPVEKISLMYKAFKPGDGSSVSGKFT